MKIKTLLIIGSAILIAFTLGIGVFVVSASRYTDTIAAQSTLTERLIREFFEQSTLAQEYVAHHDERPKTQWYLQHELLVATLASPALLQEPSLSRLEALRTGVQDLKLTFDSLVAQSESSETNVELERQLSGDLLVKSRAVTRVADDLAVATFEERARAREAADRIIFALLAALVALMTAILFFAYRRIVGSLARLQKGTKIIGGGDLAYRIDGDENDEIGQLAHAFDAMTIRLKSSYDTLEDKIKERTRELHEMSHRNVTLLESIGDGVIAIDRFWNITLWNPATSRLTGWREEEALGKPFRERVHFIREHDRKENLTFIEEAMLYGEIKQMSNSTLMLTRDGREVPVSDSAAPIFDEGGTVTGVIIVFRDATKEKESSLLRTDFAYASHQLRTPVNKALWNLEMLIEDPGTSRFRDALNIAYRGVLDVQKLAERLLMVSEIDQKRMVPEFKEIELASFLKGLFERELKDADKRGVKIDRPNPPAGAKMDADPRLLAEAIHEVVQNAVMYSPAGGKVEVEVQMEPLEFILRVHDHGLGISEEQAPLIFTKFFRGQNIPADAAGAGLGLFIAREYVRLMGGKFWFESQLGKGSTFTISIPRLRGMRE